MYTLIYDIVLSGHFKVQSVQVELDDTRTPVDVTGSVSWSGGPVRFKLLNLVHEVTLQPVVGTLVSEEDFVILQVRTHESDTKIMELRLETATGWVHMKAFPAFLEFVNIPSNYLRQDTAFLFEVSQKLF